MRATFDPLNAWAEHLTSVVYETWKTKYSIWNDGFKIFYSPVKSTPKLLIIGYQPGGDEGDWKREDKYPFERSDFSLPLENLFSVGHFRLATKMQSLFHSNEAILRDSVAFNLIFFRSHDDRKWHSTNLLRQEMEAYCFEKVQEIIEKIKPRKILILGFATYWKLQRLIGKLNSERVIGSKSRVIVRYANWNNIPIIAILHPSGSRISKIDWITIIETVQSRL